MESVPLSSSSLPWSSRPYDTSDIRLAHQFLNGQCSYVQYKNHIKYRTEELLTSLLLPNSLVQIGMGWFRFIPLGSGTKSTDSLSTPPPSSSSLSLDNMALVLLSSVFISLGRQLPSAGQGDASLDLSMPPVNLIAAFGPRFVVRQAESDSMEMEDECFRIDTKPRYPAETNFSGGDHPAQSANPGSSEAAGSFVKMSELACRKRGNSEDMEYDQCSDYDLQPNHPSPILMGAEVSMGFPMTPLTSTVPTHPTRFSDPATSVAPENKDVASNRSTPSYTPRPAAELNPPRTPQGIPFMESTGIPNHPAIRRIPKSATGHSNYQPYPQPNRHSRKLPNGPHLQSHSGGNTNLVVTIPQSHHRNFPYDQQPIVKNTAVASDTEHSPRHGSFSGTPNGTGENIVTEEPYQMEEIPSTNPVHSKRIVRRHLMPLIPLRLSCPEEFWFTIETREFPIGVSGHLVDESERTFWDPLVEPVIPSLRPYFIATVLKLFRAQRKPGRPLDPRLGLGFGDGVGIVDDAGNETDESQTAVNEEEENPATEEDAARPRTTGEVAHGLMELTAQYCGQNFAALDRDAKVLLNQALWCLGAYQLSLGPGALKRFRARYPGPTTSQLKRTHLKHCFYYSRLFAHMWGGKVPISRLNNFDISPISIIKVLSASACHQVRRALDELDARF